MDTISKNNEKKPAFISGQKTIAVIGAGAIGLSWTGLFLANGLNVVINDPRPDIRETALQGLDLIKPTLSSLGYDVADLTARLSFESELGKAVENADFIQENGPENIAFKQDLYVRLEQFAKPGALMFSSSSSIPATVFAEKMKNAERVLIGHPFNPPHLIPLVEVVPGKNTSKEATDEALNFYKALGKHPVLIQKEVTGFVANRLQCALLRESVHLVQSGVVTMEDLDGIVSSSIGLRWAAAGPFKTFTLGGGKGGFPHFLEGLGPMVGHIWEVLGAPTLDEPTKAILLEQAAESYGKIPIEELETERDEQQLAILKALNK
jgi:ketoreductase RED1